MQIMDLDLPHDQIFANDLPKTDIPYSTPIRDYYRGKVVLLTGGTGFLGHLYLQKLLR